MQVDHLIRVWQTEDLLKKIRMVKEQNICPTTKRPQHASTSSCALQKRKLDQTNKCHSHCFCCTSVAQTVKVTV